MAVKKEGEGRNSHPLQIRVLLYMAKSEIKIREPNTLIEAGQKLTREELIIWIWSLLKAKPRDKSDYVLSKEEIERYKIRKEIPIMTSEINLDELQDLFPDYFGNCKPYYYKKLLKNMEKKIAFEVKLEDYIRNLKEYGYEFVIKQLDIPTNPEEVVYYGISAILSVTLKKDNTLKIVFSPHIVPLLLELKKRYTTYDFLDILRLHSKHSIILYRLVKEKIGLKRNPFTVSVEKLNKIFGVNYKSWKPLRENVIDPAIKDLNENTRYRVSYQVVRKGKGGKVVEIKFFVEEIKLLKGINKEIIKPILEQIISSFHQGGEEITLEEFAKVLLSLKRVNPAVVIWFLLHYPEGEARLYAWKHIEMTEKNPDIKDPDRFLMSLIKDKDENLNWLLDQRTKDLIREELKKIAQNGEDKPSQPSNPLLEKIYSLWKEFPPEGKEKVLKSYKVQSLEELIEKEGLEETWGILKIYFRAV